MKNKLPLILYAISIVTCLSGCAIIPGNIYLNYVPDKNVSGLKNADVVAVDVKLDDKRIILKNNPNIISIKKNAYGVECDPITSDNDISILVSDAIKTELANRGFKIGNGGKTVEVTLEKFFSDYSIGFWCAYANADVEFSVCVKKIIDGKAKILYNQKISGLNEESVFFRPSATTGHSIEVALKNAVSKLINDKAFIDALTVQ